MSMTTYTLDNEKDIIINLKQTDNLFHFDSCRFWIKLVGVSTYFILVIGIEPIYRDYLYIESIKIISELQRNHFINGKEIVTLISHLGTIQCFLPFLIFIYIFYPINKTFLILSLIIHSSYWDNLLKMIYGNPRPFWDDTNIYPSCNGGFGNPSGHSFSSTAVFLGLPLVIIDIKRFKERNIIYSILVYFIFITIMILVIFSRVFLGAHSINQVLYGGLLGIGLYFIHCHLFNLVNPKPKFFFQLFKNKLLHIFFLIFYSGMLVAVVMVYFKCDNYSLKYTTFLTLNCQNKANYRLFNPDGLFNALSIFALIGGHLGLIFLVHYIDKYYPTKYQEVYEWDWNRKSYKNLLYKILFAMVSAFPLSLFFFVPENSDLSIIYVFKVSIPYFISCFFILGPCVWFFIYFKLANDKIYVLEINRNNICEFKKIEKRIMH